MFLHLHMRQDKDETLQTIILNVLSCFFNRQQKAHFKVDLKLCLRSSELTDVQDNGI